MKTTVLIVSILISTLFSTVLLAQEKNEFKLGHGISGINYLMTFGSHLLPFHNPDNYSEVFTLGTSSIAYKRRLNDRISLGAQVDYSYFTEKTDPNKPKEPTHLILPYLTFDYRYITKPNFELYSSAMVGAIIENDEEFEGTTFLTVPHCTLLGIKRGNKHAFFGELGIGLGQLVSAGYAYKF